MKFMLLSNMTFLSLQTHRGSSENTQPTTLVHNQSATAAVVKSESVSWTVTVQGSDELGMCGIKGQQADQHLGTLLSKSLLPIMSALAVQIAPRRMSARLYWLTVGVSPPISPFSATQNLRIMVKGIDAGNGRPPTDVQHNPLKHRYLIPIVP